MRPFLIHSLKKGQIYLLVLRHFFFFTLLHFIRGVGSLICHRVQCVNTSLHAFISSSLNCLSQSAGVRSLSVVSQPLGIVSLVFTQKKTKFFHEVCTSLAAFNQAVLMFGETVSITPPTIDLKD